VVLLSITKLSECETHLLVNRSGLFIEALADSFHHYPLLLYWVVHLSFTSDCEYKEKYVYSYSLESSLTPA
jgi:hypothetical protein